MRIPRPLATAWNSPSNVAASPTTGGSRPPVLAAEPVVAPRTVARRRDDRFVEQLVHAHLVALGQPVGLRQARDARLGGERAQLRTAHVDGRPDDGDVTASVVQPSRGPREVELRGLHLHVGALLGVRPQHPRDDVDGRADDVADAYRAAHAGRGRPRPLHHPLELREHLHRVLAQARSIGHQLDPPCRAFDKSESRLRLQAA